MKSFLVDYVTKAYGVIDQWKSGNDAIWHGAVDKANARSAKDALLEAHRLIRMALGKIRHCDLYDDERSAWEAYLDGREWADVATEDYEKWLFDIAENELMKTNGGGEE